MFELQFSEAADAELERLRKSNSEQGLCKQVQEALRKLRQNPRHGGLHTHKYESLRNPVRPSEPVFESYAQNHTPGAYRVFWCYGLARRQMYIINITPHP